jgi:hypothetical protein
MGYRCIIKYACWNEATNKYEPVISESWYEMRPTLQEAQVNLDKVHEQIALILQRKKINHTFLERTCVEDA